MRPGWGGEGRRVRPGGGGGGAGGGPRLRQQTPGRDITLLVTSFLRCKRTVSRLPQARDQTKCVSFTLARGPPVTEAPVETAGGRDPMGESGLSKAAEAPALASRAPTGSSQRARGSRPCSVTGWACGPRGASNILLGRQSPSLSPSREASPEDPDPAGPSTQNGTPRGSPRWDLLAGCAEGTAAAPGLLRPGRTHQAVSRTRRPHRRGGRRTRSPDRVPVTTCLAPRVPSPPESPPGTPSRPHRGPATEAGTQRLGRRLP